MVEISDNVLIKILLFLLIFAISSQILRKFFDNKGSTGIISLIISIIGAFYISPSQLDFLDNTYTITSALILISIPYIIIFFFIYNIGMAGFLRRIIWLFYSIINIFFIMNYLNTTEEITFLILTILIILTIIILFFDKTIQNKFNSSRNLKNK